MGKDTSPGACIWANDFCIQTIATHLRVCLHIMDEESGRTRGGRGGRGSVDGSTGGGGGKRRKTGTFVTIRPETTVVLIPTARTKVKKVGGTLFCSERGGSITTSLFSVWKKKTMTMTTEKLLLYQGQSID